MHAKIFTDRSHPQAIEVYARLDKLAEQMKEAGYVSGTSFALHDVEENKESFSYHSEKLAIAFGFIKTAPGNWNTHPNQKNLSVCGDCHTFMKFISKINGR